MAMDLMGEVRTDVRIGIMNVVASCSHIPLCWEVSSAIATSRMAMIRASCPSTDITSLS
jgi:hypothetical protein